MKNTELDDQDVIIIENPEVLSGNTYIGEIKSIHTGYVFIHNVKRGYETIETDDDVFCPVPKDANFEVGQLVKFSKLKQDRDRPGKSRTENISLIPNTSLDVNTPEGRMTAIMQLSKTVSPYHQLKKIIAEDDIAKAGENKPLAEFIQQIAWLLNQNGGYNPEDINNFAEAFIKKTFSMLGPLGVKCSIMDNVDKEAEKRMIEDTISLYRENGLEGQIDSLQKEYEQFLRVREAFTLMHSNNLLNYSSVIDTKHLPELGYAFPVWFVNAKERLMDFTSDDDPLPDEAIKFFADCVGSREWAWLYQIYNRRTRPLSQFRGKDIMPPNLVKIMKKANELFDFVAIMTSYHDIASREWSDPNWLRNIDPLMVGFLKGLPYMFVLGRWSGTGIFPMLLDCIADTSGHLKFNKHLLKNFKKNTYWYRGFGGSEKNLLASSSTTNGLENYADRLLLAYERGLLFPFLRGELANDPEYKFPE